MTMAQLRFGITPEFAFKDWRNSRKTSVDVTDAPVVIRNGRSPKTNLMHYHMVKL